MQCSGGARLSTAQCMPFRQCAQEMRGNQPCMLVHVLSQASASTHGDESEQRTMKMMEGLATSSTAMVRRLRCSTDRPDKPGLPTRA